MFKGDVDVEGPAGKVTVAKKKTATFDAADDDKYTLANNVEEAPLDSWDKDATAYHDQYAKNNSSPYGYGVSDLNYYGSYSNVPGYGTMWQPYFTGSRLGSLHGRRLVLVSRLRLHVRLGLSLGMDALPLRKLDDGSWNGLDVAARGLEFMGHRSALCRNVAGQFPPARGAYNWHC